MKGKGRKERINGKKRKILIVKEKERIDVERKGNVWKGKKMKVVIGKEMERSDKGNKENIDRERKGMD